MGRRDVENIIKATEPTDEECAFMEKQEAEIKLRNQAAKEAKVKQKEPKAKKDKPKAEKEKKEPKEPKAEKKVKKAARPCGGKTKAGVDCKRSAVTDGTYCPAHRQ